MSELEEDDALRRQIADGPAPPPAPLLLREADWPPDYNSGETFLGRAIVHLSASMFGDGHVHDDQSFEQLLQAAQHALQQGRLVAVALGQEVPAERWRGPRGRFLLLHCEITEFELLSGRPPHWTKLRPLDAIGVTTVSLKRFLSNDADPASETTPALCPDDDMPVKGDEAATGTDYIPPFVQLILEAVAEFGITASRAPKHPELVAYFLEKRLPDGTKPSLSQAKSLATFARDPSAMKGGNKRV